MLAKSNTVCFCCPTLDGGSDSVLMHLPIVPVHPIKRGFKAWTEADKGPTHTELCSALTSQRNVHGKTATTRIHSRARQLRPWHSYPDGRKKEAKDADGVTPKHKWLQELTFSGSLPDGPIKNSEVNKGESGGRITGRAAQCKTSCVFACTNGVCSQLYEREGKKWTAPTSTNQPRTLRRGLKKQPPPWADKTAGWCVVCWGATGRSGWVKAN